MAWDGRSGQASALGPEPQVGRVSARFSPYTQRDPAAIARSLKRSAELSHWHKSEPFRSAMSMLTFYINRAGDQLPARRRKTLEAAKDELGALFHRPRRG